MIFVTCSGARSGGTERECHVRECLAGLGNQVARTHKVALSVVSYLSGDEHQSVPDCDDDVC